MQAAVVVILHTKWDGRCLICFYLYIAHFTSILPQEILNVKHRIKKKRKKAHSSEKLLLSNTNMKLKLNVAFSI